MTSTAHHPVDLEPSLLEERTARLDLEARRISADLDWSREQGLPEVFLVEAVFREAMVRAERADSARAMLLAARADKTIDPGDELLGYEAFVRALLGEKDAAVRIIEEYVAKHPEHLGGFKRANFWWWAPLRDHPGFQRITKLGE